jgi:hypothetical protein
MPASAGMPVLDFGGFRIAGSGMLHFPELNRGKCKTYLVACVNSRQTR